MASTTVARSVEAAVADWPGVTVHDHRFGGREFRLGSREVGHLHGDRQADVAYPRPVRDAIVSADLAGPHHLFPDSGWITYHVRGPGSVDRIIDLLRLSYLVHAAALRRRDEYPELESLDPVAELEALGIGADVTAAVRSRIA